MPLFALFVIYKIENAEADNHAAGWNKCHLHGMQVISGSFIFQCFCKPIGVINDDRDEVDGKNYKMQMVEISTEVIKACNKGQKENWSGKNKCTIYAKPVTDGHIATQSIFFMLVYLCQRVIPANQ